MIMTAFRVENYRSVLDSGWVDAGEITAIVGKNESGKTSLLKALWKFNPFTDEAYDLNREWPRGRRREMSDEKPIVTVRFTFSESEREKLATIGESTTGITGVEITRCYNGTYSYNFLPQNPESQPNPSWVMSVIKKHFGNTTLLAFDHVRAGYQGVLDALRNSSRMGGERQLPAPAVEPLAVTGRYGAATATAVRGNILPQSLQEPMNNAVSELNANLPMRQAMEMTHKWLPTFIYMDDYKVFKGSAQLEQVKQRRDACRLTEEDRTIIKIMEMAGLNLVDEAVKGNLPDKEQRMLDMNDASQTLTQEIADRWSQKKYEVLFQADGQHFITFVKDADTSILVPLEERSKGFQWFFSFDMTFMYETNGEFKNAIILLDEPGLHLHAAAQRDLLSRIRQYAKNNQLLYTTHLPFMVDFTHLDEVYVAVDNGKEGTRVHKSWDEADADSRFTIQAALGISLAQSVFAEQFNVIVEDITEYCFLTLFSSLFKEAGKEGLDEELVVTPAGGASRLAYVNALLRDQKLHYTMLLNFAPSEGTPCDQIADLWLENDQHLLLLNTILGVSYPCTVEDLLNDEYYLGFVQVAYQSKLGLVPLVLGDGWNRPLLPRVQDALANRGIPDFNRDRIARRIMRDLAKRTFSELPPVTVERFQKLITAINASFRAWKARNGEAK